MFGPCCIGECCGPGSYCCQNAGPHSHDDVDDERARQADIGANLPVGYVDTFEDR